MILCHSAASWPFLRCRCKLSSVLCRKCSRFLGAPDREHRYCPYCGVIRVLPDPPEDPAARQLLIVGEDVFGPVSGDQYQYRGTQEVPARLDPRSGPFTDGVAQDLFAASGAPLPAQALHGFRGGLSAGPGEQRSQRSLGGELWQATVRHGQVYVLARGGHISALDSRSLGFVRPWRYPMWDLASAGMPFRVSETLVYGMVRPANAVLLGVDAGRGEPQIEFPLGHADPDVLISQDQLFVLGDARHQQQSLEIYGLAELRAGAEPVQRTMLRLQGSAPAQRPELLRLGSDVLFAAGDGKLYRWMLKEADWELLWPNLQARSLRRKWLSFGPREVGGVLEPARPDEAPGLILLRQGEIGLETPRVIESLPLLRESRSHLLAAAEGVLYAAVQRPGDAVRIYGLDLHHDGAEPQLIHTLTGTQGDTVRDLQVVPWRGEPWLMVQMESGFHQSFWLIHPATGVATELEAHPPAAYRVQVLWDARRLILVNLTQGELTSLATEGHR